MAATHPHYTAQQDHRSPFAQSFADKNGSESSSPLGSPTRLPRMDDLISSSKPAGPITAANLPSTRTRRPQTSPVMDAVFTDNISTHIPARRKRGQSVQFQDSQCGSVLERQLSAAHTSPVRSTFANNSIGARRRDGGREGIFRKTSQTCRKFQKAISSRSRRSSIDGMEGIETPATQESSQSSRLFDRLAHPNRMLSSLKVSRYDTPQPASVAAAALGSGSRMSAPLASSHGLLEPESPGSPPDSAFLRPRQPSAHALGRGHQSSSSVSSFEGSREEKRSRVGSLSSAADSGADLGSNATPDVEMTDAEPQVDLNLDPLAYLPHELNTLIFSYLDAESLRACQAIGPWQPFASDFLAWRSEFQREFQCEAAVNPGPIQIGGMGLGRPDTKLQQWEKMYSARKAIDANWAAGKGRAIYMAGHTDSVYCVQFDEKKIITGSRDRTIRVWDINTNRCIKVIGGPSVRPVLGPRVLRTVDYPHFQHAEASVNGLPYGHHIFHTPSDYHSASILCLQYDDEILVTGSSDNDLIVWDVNTYEPIKRLRAHQGGVLDVAFDDQHIVSCSKDCTIVIWDRKTLKPLKTLKGHNGPVNAVQLRGNLLVSASGDGVARLWDLSKLECIREFPAKERGLAAVEFSDDAKYVLAGGNDHLTYKFDVATGKEVLQYTGHTQLVRSLFLDTQNKRVISGSYDLDLRVYDYDSGELITMFPEWTTSWMLAAKCDYRRIVSTSQDGRILMIDFGFDAEGAKIEGAELLAGTDPLACDELNRFYPKFAHPSIPRSK